MSLVGLVASTVGDRAKIAKGICVFQHFVDSRRTLLAHWSSQRRVEDELLGVIIGHILFDHRLGSCYRGRVEKHWSSCILLTSKNMDYECIHPTSCRADCT